MNAVLEPAYAQDDLRIGIVHIGVGNFHRAHQAMYLDRLFAQGKAQDWAICGVGVMPGDARMRDALRARAMRYVLAERFPDGSVTARRIGSIVDYLYAPDDPEAVLERLADPNVRIVSLTITEGGYHVDDRTGVFDLTRPDVAADLRAGSAPRTAFGLIVEGLRRRRDRGVAPFTVVSCDNLQGNGAVARCSVTQFARAKDPELGAWIEREVRFPNSMVDRITPVTGAEERALLVDEFGVDEPWPVVCEGFAQWVLQDRFSAGRPPLEEVGVLVVDDVAPFERMKLRLLNASHQALAYAGYLMGYRFAHEAVNDPLVGGFVRRYMRDEAEPTLGVVPGVDLADYQQRLLERFANPYIKDTLLRLATDGSDRIAKFVLPVVRDRIADGASIDLCAVILASWAVFARGVDEQGVPIEVADRRHDLVRDAVDRAGDDPAVLAADRRLFADLAGAEEFIAAFVQAYRTIRGRGIRATLEALVGDRVQSKQ